MRNDCSMKRRILTLALAALCAVSLGGCGDWEPIGTGDKVWDVYTFGDSDALIEQWNASGSGTAEEGTE